jgi:hypothetical protein
MDTLPDNQLPPADTSSPALDEELDPRIQVRSFQVSDCSTSFVTIQVELDRLNYANEAINHLELQLDVIPTEDASFRSFRFVHLGSTKSVERTSQHIA